MKKISTELYETELTVEEVVEKRISKDEKRERKQFQWQPFLTETE